MNLEPATRRTCNERILTGLVRTTYLLHFLPCQKIDLFVFDTLNRQQDRQSGTIGQNSKVIIAAKEIIQSVPECKCNLIEVLILVPDCSLLEEYRHTRKRSRLDRSLFAPVRRVSPASSPNLRVNDQFFNIDLQAIQLVCRFRTCRDESLPGEILRTRWPA